MLSFRVSAVLFAAYALMAQDHAPGFVGSPDVHGDRVVFTWEDDLWPGSLKGGPARRLTTHPGLETEARFSPDGTWIAVGIETLLKQLTENPAPVFPPVPAYPKR